MYTFHTRSLLSSLLGGCLRKRHALQNLVVMFTPHSVSPVDRSYQRMAIIPMSRFSRGPDIPEVCTVIDRRVLSCHRRHPLLPPMPLSCRPCLRSDLCARLPPTSHRIRVSSKTNRLLAGDVLWNHQKKKKTSRCSLVVAKTRTAPPSPIYP